jgi:hypothetical protein
MGPTVAARATFGAGRENSVVTHEVDPGSRNQCGEAAQQGIWGEVELAGAVGEGAFEVIDEASVFGKLQAFGGDSGAQAVTAQLLQALAVVLGDDPVGVEGKALEAGRER